MLGAFSKKKDLEKVEEKPQENERVEVKKKPTRPAVIKEALGSVSCLIKVDKKTREHKLWRRSRSSI